MPVSDKVWSSVIYNKFLQIMKTNNPTDTWERAIYTGWHWRSTKPCWDEKLPPGVLWPVPAPHPHPRAGGLQLKETAFSQCCFPKDAGETWMINRGFVMPDWSSWLPSSYCPGWGWGRRHWLVPYLDLSPVHTQLETVSEIPSST